MQMGSSCRGVPLRLLPGPATLNEFVHQNSSGMLSQNEQNAKRREEAWPAALIDADEGGDAGDIEIAPGDGISWLHRWFTD